MSEGLTVAHVIIGLFVVNAVLLTLEVTAARRQAAKRKRAKATKGGE